MDLPLTALAAVFLVWWGCSAVNQFRSGALTVPLRRRLPFGLIPLWTFFAPNPARADARLVWREECDGRWSGWRELHFGFAPLRRRWLVNPELIPNKAVADLVGSLLRVRPETGKRGALLSSPYVALLAVVLDQPRLPACTAVQFAIVRTSRPGRRRELEVAFLSEVHAVGELVADVR